MTSDLSANVLRPSVIKWVGKDFTIDLDFNGRKKDDFDCPKVGSVRQYTRTAQEQKQANFSNESSPARYHSDDIINKSSFPYSKVKNPERKYVCMICKRNFKWRSHWKSHERIHTGERPFKCKTCGKAFTRSDGLQCHKKVHINITKSNSAKTEENPAFNKDVLQDLTVSKQEKVFLCAYCGRTFGSFAGYCRHTDRHKDTDDLKCHICNTNFNRPSALKIHNRVHTGLKPYQCNICSKAFSIRGNLKRHLFVHSGEKPYNCTYCSSCFNSSSHLTRHIRSKHKSILS